MAQGARSRLTVRLGDRRARRFHAGACLRLRVLAVLLLAAGCSPGPVPPPPQGASATPGAGAGTRLVVEMGGKIGCATFPYSCRATLSVLPAGTAVDAEWRPPASDPWWGPDASGGTSTDRLDPNPVGSVPRIPPGRHEIVISLLGSSDVPSYTPDGSVATDLLSRCVGNVEVRAATDVVDVGITFTPDPTSFRATCTLELKPRPE